jgi:hypothetical protein
MYAHEQEDHGHPQFAILYTLVLYDTGDNESQDSGLGCLGAPEVDIKEHTLDPWRK